MEPNNITPTEPAVNPTAAPAEPPVNSPDMPAGAPVASAPVPTASEPAAQIPEPAATAPAAPAPVAPDSAVPEQPAPVTPPVSPLPSQPSPVNLADSAATTTNAPVNADVANAALNPPVNPVVTPNAPAGVAASGTMSMNQMFQPQPANNPGVISEATPIAVPEGPKAPDPVEEELKAPLKAAGPVPGSIGSAVSMPPADSAAQPQNVAFNDPAQGNPMTANAQPAAKKNSIFDKLMAKTKMTKSTLILLCALAGFIVVALIVVLILVATGNL